MKKYLIEYKGEFGTHWVTCGHWKARTSLGAIQQFVRTMASNSEADIAEIRVTEVLMLSGGIRG